MEWTDEMVSQHVGLAVDAVRKLRKEHLVEDEHFDRRPPAKGGVVWWKEDGIRRLAERVELLSPFLLDLLAPKNGAPAPQAAQPAPEEPAPRLFPRPAALPRGIAKKRTRRR